MNVLTSKKLSVEAYYMLSKYKSIAIDILEIWMLEAKTVSVDVGVTGKGDT